MERTDIPANKPSNPPKYEKKSISLNCCFLISGLYLTSPNSIDTLKNVAPGIGLFSLMLKFLIRRVQSKLFNLLTDGNFFPQH